MESAAGAAGLRLFEQRSRLLPRIMSAARPVATAVNEKERAPKDAPLIDRP